MCVIPLFNNHKMVWWAIPLIIDRYIDEYIDGYIDVKMVR